MKFKFFLPSLAASDQLRRRGTKYFRFPPLGLASLAAYLRPDDQADIQDEHVETFKIDDTPTWSSSRSTYPRPTARTAWPTITARAALTCAWGDCT